MLSYRTDNCVLVRVGKGVACPFPPCALSLSPAVSAPRLGVLRAELFK